MNIQIREYKDSDIQEMNRIWNRVVDDGVAFPQEDDLTEETGRGFFAGQTYTAVAEDTDTGKVLGLYILHPNDVGRILRTFKIKKNVEVTDNGKDNF